MPYHHELPGNHQLPGHQLDLVTKLRNNLRRLREAKVWTVTVELNEEELQDLIIEKEHPALWP